MPGTTPAAAGGKCILPGLRFQAGWIDAMGGRRFDLVMGSPPPDPGPDLHKLMASSRGYCLLVFVQAKDSLKDKIYAALYRSNSERTRYEEGRVFY